MAELRIVSFGFAPKGWALCNGQLLPINQNQALFSLLGTTYGGDGRTNFALPDLRGRTALHRGGGLTQGQKIGQEAQTLSQNEMPTHLHFAQGSSTAGTIADPTNNVFGVVAGRIYTDPQALTTMLPASVTNVGGTQPHENRQPFLVLNVIIALQGIFPSQN